MRPFFCFEWSEATFAFTLLPAETFFPATSISKSNAFPLSSSGDIDRYIFPFFTTTFIFL
jgi:hypothetical protein